MPYQIEMGGQVVGVMGRDGKVVYDRQRIKEIVEGQAPSASHNGKGGTFSTTVRKTYKFDNSRVSNNDAIYSLWKENPVMQNRIRQLNALVFGRGFNYSYDDTTQKTIDRFWRLNRIKAKLNAIMTDCQLFGETFIGLFPQKTGDVLIAVYESNNVMIDFDPQCVDNVRQYIVTYRDEEKSQDVQLYFMPAYTYLNNIEFASPIGKTVTKIRNSMGIGKTGLNGYDGLMIHVKFNNSSAESHGTSDFRQVYGVLNDYMDFRSDRLTIHQMYGSPMFDITIDTDDVDKITARIDELAGFTIGSNPVHNTSETWKPLEFKGTADSAEYDEKAMRGLICAGTGFPEYLLFNQSQGGKNDDGAFALNKMAEDMQDSFGDAFVEMHKVAVSYAGGDITKIEDGEIIFPEISTMSEKAKAETYVLKVGAQICSRETASYNTGHNWMIEEAKILDEQTKLNIGQTSGMSVQMGNDPTIGGTLGGRFSTKQNNQDPSADHGDADRQARMQANNIKSQTFGNRKQNN